MKLQVPEVVISGTNNLTYTIEGVTNSDKKRFSYKIVVPNASNWTVKDIKISTLSLGLTNTNVSVGPLPVKFDCTVQDDYVSCTIDSILQHDTRTIIISGEPNFTQTTRLVYTTTVSAPGAVTKKLQATTYFVKPTDNLIKNGGFEVNTNWRTAYEGVLVMEDFSVKEADSIAKYEGSNGALISAKPSGRIILYQNFPTTSGKTYHGFARIKVASPAIATTNDVLKLFVYDESNVVQELNIVSSLVAPDEYSSSPKEIHLSAPGAWKLIEFSFVAQAGTTSHSIYITSGALATDLEAYIDDVIIFKEP